MDQDVSDAARLDAVGTVADAKRLSDRLKDAPEAKNQPAFADVIVLNKIDLVSPEELERSRAASAPSTPTPSFIARRTARSRSAKFWTATPSTSTASWRSSLISSSRAITIITTRTCNPIPVQVDGEVDPEKFMPWISNLTQVEGPNILRCKGIVAFPGEPKRFVFQGVHMILDGDVQDDWKPGQKRNSKVVFIGRDLNEKAIREEFLACAV